VSGAHFPRVAMFLGMLTATIGCQSLDSSAVREPDSLNNPTPTPATGGNAFYQGYEHGFMVLVFGIMGDGSILLREDCICAYSVVGGKPHILSPGSLGFKPHPGRDWYRYCTYLDDRYPELPDSSTHGLPILRGAFRDLSSYEVIRADLGGPVDEGIIYKASIPSNPPQNTAPEGAWYLPIISQPDGSVLYCGAQAARAM
jgi:hypothetical protein